MYSSISQQTVILCYHRSAYLRQPNKRVDVVQLRLNPEPWQGRELPYAMTKFSTKSATRKRRGAKKDALFLLPIGLITAGGAVSTVLRFFAIHSGELELSVNASPR
jgi:hypothetical protein